MATLVPRQDFKDAGGPFRLSAASSPTHDDLNFKLAAFGAARQYLANTRTGRVLSFRVKLGKGNQFPTFERGSVLNHTR
jgi:hypothetical protein